jgi:hypothetical protein
MTVRQVEEYLQFNEKKNMRSQQKKKYQRQMLLGNGYSQVNWSIVGCSIPRMNVSLLTDW